MQIINYLKRPSAPFIALFCALFALTLGGMTAAVILLPRGALHYALYALSAVGLAYFVYLLVTVFVPKMRSAAVALLSKNQFTRHIITGYGFRTVVFSAAGFVVNVAYVALQLVAGIVGRSVWHFTVAAFYVFLSFIRGVVFVSVKRGGDDPARQIRIYRMCGYMLNLLPFAIAGVIVLLNRTDKTFKYADMMIYAVALYTFIRVVSAIVQVFKARRYGGFVIRALRNINLCSAVYSLFVLQVAMLQAFGNGNSPFANALSGALVALVIFLVGAGMIVRAHRTGGGER